MAPPPATIESVDALRQACARPLPALLWIATEEPLLSVEAGDLVRAAARAQGYAERVLVEVGTGFDGSAFVGLVQARSLFGERRLIDVRQGARPTKDFGESLMRAVHALDDDTRVLLAAPKPDRTQQQSAWYRAIEPGLVLAVLPKIDGRGLARWLDGRLRRAGLMLDEGAVALLLERSEGNPVAADQAVRRLELLAPRGARLSAAAIDEAVQDSARYEVFALVDAALRGDVAQVLRVTDALRLADAPVPLLVWALGDALRRLLKLHAARARGEPLPNALRSIGAFGVREALYREAARRLDGRMTAALLRETAWLDKLSKGVAAGVGVTIDTQARTGRGETSAAGGSEAGPSHGPADVWGAVERIVLAIAGVPRLA